MKSNFIWGAMLATLLLCGSAMSLWAKDPESSAPAPSENKAAEALPAPIPYTSNPVLAIVDGQPIHLEDIRNKRIHDLTSQLYEALQSELSAKVSQALQAKHQEELSQAKQEVTPEQIAAFYKQNNLEKHGTLETLTPQIKKYMEMQFAADHSMQQMKLAEAKGWLVNYLQAPKEFNVSAPIKTAYVRGNVQANVFFLEFSDFQCPYCSRVQESVNNLIQKYGKKVAFGYRHFPLSFHTEADEAAIAVECAREQGKFEEMHKLLYQNQRTQHLEELKEFAKQAKVGDLKKFNACLEQEKYRELVNTDIKDGAELGISGTPGFVIGFYNPKTKVIEGEVISGALPEAQFDAILQKYLQKAPKS